VRASHQELAQLQSSQNAVEQQLNQTKSKLTQEVQQAKKDHNMLQAEMEKVQHTLPISSPNFFNYFLFLSVAGSVTFNLYRHRSLPFITSSSFSLNFPISHASCKAHLSRRESSYLCLLITRLCCVQASHQKSQLQREVEEQRQKLLRSEQSLQASQAKEQDLRKKMEVSTATQDLIPDTFFFSFWSDSSQLVDRPCYEMYAGCFG